MLVTEAITEIRNKINDRDCVGLDDSELLSYLNEAVQWVTAAMIGAGSAELIQEQNVTTNSFTVPANFAKFCGIYPVRMTGKVGTLLEVPPLKLRYFVSYAALTNASTMPFNHIALSQVAIKKACQYAMNQEKLDVQQDKMLENELSQAVALSMGAGETK